MNLLLSATGLESLSSAGHDEIGETDAEWLGRGADRGGASKLLMRVVRPERFELPAYRFVVCRSIQLS